MNQPKVTTVSRATTPQRDLIRRLLKRHGIASCTSGERVSFGFRPLYSAAGQSEADLQKFPQVDTWIDSLDSQQASAVITTLKARD